jgi:hypothetical protein
LFYLKPIFNKEFKIIEKNFNPLLVIFNLSLIFLPFIVLNCYYDQIINLLDKYLIKHFTIYCDSNDKTDFNKILKNETIIGPSIKIINVSNLYDMDTKFLHHFIKEYIKSNNELKLSESDYNVFMAHSYLEYKVDVNVLNFINEYIQVISSHNISKNNLIEFIYKLYDLDMGYKNKLDALKSELYNQMVELNNLKNEKYNNYLIASNNYKKFCNHIYRQEEELAQNHLTEVNELNIEQQKYISDEINKFSKLSNKFNIILKNPLSFLMNNSNNLNTTVEEKLDDYQDLFFKSNKSSSSINSVDSDKTIKQSDYKKTIK